MTSSRTWVISANDLLDGDVVYLAVQGGWTRALSDAALISDTDHADTLLVAAKAQSGTVVDPYLLDVTTGPHGVAPSHIRDRLRDSGPSFRPDLQRARP